VRIVAPVSRRPALHFIFCVMQNAKECLWIKTIPQLNEGKFIVFELTAETFQELNRTKVNPFSELTGDPK
jgi:hypothetical protein